QILIEDLADYCAGKIDVVGGAVEFVASLPVRRSLLDAAYQPICDRIISHALARIVERFTHAQLRSAHRVPIPIEVSRDVPAAGGHQKAEGPRQHTALESP